jgi:polysaccharide pyruvyl transferase WcaK-like protein
MRIFVVGMPGDGNLGDDLISTLLVRRISQRWPNAEIGLLHGPYPNPFGYPEHANTLILNRPIRSAWKSFWPRTKAIQDFLSQTNLILIGGGGLFQDAFSPFTIHRWMKYAFKRQTRRVPVWAVGVGFGYLSTRFSRWYLRRVLNRFSGIQVRDLGSKRVIEEFSRSSAPHPEIILSTDIVTGSSLEGTPFDASAPKDPEMLGCSVRPWPGLQFARTQYVCDSFCVRPYRTIHTRV